jgi:hypothetical protein
MVVLNLEDKFNQYKPILTQTAVLDNWLDRCLSCNVHGDHCCSKVERELHEKK